MARRQPYGLCQRCGFRYYLNELKKEWTGLRVCKPCFDPRPPEQRPPRVRPEGLPKFNSSPDVDPVFGKANIGDL